MDWSAPWFRPLAPVGAPSLARWQVGAPVHEALNASASATAPVRFVPQSALPEGEAYEHFIFHTRSVPQFTRRGSW